MSSDAGPQAEYIELTIEPIPPDTVSSAKAELSSLIEEALREAGQQQLLDDGELKVEIEKTFPTDQAIVIGLTLLSGMAFETYKKIVLPRLKKKFRVWEKRRRKGKRSG